MESTDFFTYINFHWKITRDLGVTHEKGLYMGVNGISDLQYIRYLQNNKLYIGFSAYAITGVPSLSNLGHFVKGKQIETDESHKIHSFSIPHLGENWKRMGKGKKEDLHLLYL